MNLTYEAFSILESAIEHETISCTLGNTSTMTELLNKGWIRLVNEHEGSITDKGKKAMEPYAVRRAIYIAAGRGSRLRHITEHTPKPLVKVDERMMIETTLDAVVQTGIEEIIIVRGYLGHMFDQLKHKYPQITFIENDTYEVYNNIYSAYLVRDYLQNAYVLEADLVLENPKLIRKYHYQSNYLGIYKEATEDWCFDIRDKRIIRAKVGGEKCYQMYGISYWNESQGQQLAKDLEDAVEQKKMMNCYWDEVALNFYEREVYVRSCKDGDIVEIDTVEELEGYQAVSN